METQKLDLSLKVWCKRCHAWTHTPCEPGRYNGEKGQVK